MPATPFTRKIFIFLYLFLLFCPGGVTAQAQQYLASLTGIVKDPTGALISDASITVTNVGTHLPTVVTSSGSGVYTFPFLSPGTYEITVEAASFSKLQQKGLVLTASDKKLLDLVLMPGANTETVTVTSNGDFLDTGTANLGQILSTREVTDLPNIGRNPFILSTLTTGVFSSTYATTKASQFTQPYSGVAVQVISNGISGHDRITLDGVPDDAPERLSGVNYTGFVPSPEAVQEVKTQTALYDAQYGHSDGLVINTVLRNGENQFHGSAYYVFQNTYLDANTFERSRNGQARANNQYNQPGAVLDGPIRIPHLYDGRDKTFFLIAYERIQNNAPQTTSGLVPTLAQRAGDFSASGQRAIYDPLTTDSSGARTQFPGNIIPASRLDSVAKAILNYIPVPNANNSATQNFVSAGNSTSYDHYNSLVFRIDEAINGKNKLILTGYRSRRQQIPSQQGFPALAGSPASMVNRDNNGGSIDLVTSLSPLLTLDSRIGLHNHPFGLFPFGGPNILNTLGFPSSVTGNVPKQTFPGISFSDSYLGNTAGTAQFSNSNYLNFSELLSRSFSNHSVRVGFEYQVLRYSVASPTLSTFGSFAFSRNFTGIQANSAGATGDPVADFLLGYPDNSVNTTSGNTLTSNGEQTNVGLALQQLYFAGFIQDDWRVTPKLTLNIGLRYDVEAPMTDRQNRFNAGFCTTCANPIQVAGVNSVGGLQFVSGSNRHPYQTDYNNVQPRIGVSYHAAPAVVLRAGFGIINVQTVDPGTTNGFTTTTPFVGSTNNNYTPANTLSNPYPNGFNQPTGSSQGLATLVGNNLVVSTTNHTVPVVYQYSANVELQLPGSFRLDVGYVGTQGRQFPVTQNINALAASYLASGQNFSLSAYNAKVAPLNVQVTNPFYGVLPSTSTQGSSAKIAESSLLTPFPLFGSVNTINLPIGQIAYNSMQNRLTRRFSHGLTIHADFTWAKQFNQTIFVNAADSQPARREDLQPNLYFTFAGSYRIPTPLAQHLLAREILGGWEVNLVTRVQNGILVTNPSNAYLIGDARQGNVRSRSKIFNTCYLNTAGQPVLTASSVTGCTSSGQQPVFQQLPSSFVLSNVNSSIGIPGIRIPITPLQDVSLFKTFTFHEGATFEIRGEFFNVFNSANFAGPNTSLGSAAFGSETLTQANDPRIGQLTARFNF